MEGAPRPRAHGRSAPRRSGICFTQDEVLAIAGSRSCPARFNAASATRLSEDLPLSPAVTTYAALVIAVVLEIIATSLLKTSEQFTRLWPTVMMGLCYMAAFYFLSYTLRTMPVGIAYALWSGIGIVLISLVGFIVFKQSLDLPAIVGIGLILAGVLIINLMSKSVSH
ncbi:hypothetical protein FZC33_11605 [Labrys sp. KNU-23]|nr:hypothetical protein FZC33_11605 [Labrys sp. KNU-23]